MIEYQRSLTASTPLPTARRSRRRKSGGSGSRFMVLVLIALFCAGGYIVLEWALRIPVPHYPARPEFGTATVQLWERFQGDVTTMEVEIDASGLVSRGRWNGTAFSDAQVLTDASYVYLWGGEGDWKRSARNGLETVMAVPLAVVGMVHWSDWVPAEAEEFVSIGGRETVYLEGRQLTRFEVMVDAPEFAGEEREAFAAWAAKVGALSSEPVRFVLYVDDAGIVWTMESGDPSRDFLRITLVSLSPAPVLIDYPIQYQDPDGRVVSLAG